MRERLLLDLEAEWSAVNAVMLTRRSSARASTPVDWSGRCQRLCQSCHPNFRFCLVILWFSSQSVIVTENYWVRKRRYGVNWRIPRSRWGARLMASIIMASAVVGTAVPAAQALAAQESFAITVPPVPEDIKVPAGNKVFLVGHAVGTQNYVCLPSGKDFKFTLFTPQATLFSDDGRQLITHYFSPNTFEGDTVRATWQDSRDSSAVWAQATNSSSDPNFVAAGAIFLAGCSLKQDMAYQPKNRPLAPSDFFTDGRSERPLPRASIAVTRKYRDRYGTLFFQSRL